MRTGFYRAAAAVLIGIGIAAVLHFPPARAAGKAVRASTPAAISGSAVRRLAAELLVLRGDVRRLAVGDLSSRHANGVTDRIRGGLAPLVLLVRAARDGDPGLSALAPGTVDALRASLADGRLDDLAAGLDALVRRYPLPARGVLPPDDRPAAVRRAARIHESFCAGCHDTPDLDVDRPAWNLAGLARTMPAREFAARLLIGVKGETLMALENPLTDFEMSALIAFYRGGGNPGE